MADSINKKIWWASIFGFCFLLSVVIQQTILRAINTISPANTTDFYFNFILWSLALLPFFGTLILTVRGYVYLAEKYDRNILKAGAWIFIVAAAAMYIVILVSVFQHGTHADAIIADMLTGFIMFPYVVGIITVALGTYTLRDRLGNAIFAPMSLGLLLLFELVLVLIFYLSGTSAPAFVTLYTFRPVYESLWVISSIILFLRAAHD